MFENLKLNGDWLQMQKLVHELNNFYEVQNKRFYEKRGTIPFMTSHDFLMPKDFGDMAFYR